MCAVNCCCDGDTIATMNFRLECAGGGGLKSRCKNNFATQRAGSTVDARRTFSLTVVNCTRCNTVRARKPKEERGKVPHAVVRSDAVCLLVSPFLTVLQVARGLSVPAHSSRPRQWRCGDMSESWVHIGSGRPEILLHPSLPPPHAAMQANKEAPAKASLVPLRAALQQLAGAAEGELMARADDVCKELQRFQEQPRLLDPCLEEAVKPFLPWLYTHPATSPQCKAAALVLYTVTKVRGAKTAVKAFSHQASDLHPILRQMRSMEPGDHELWQVRYVLLLWLSLVCMLPFKLSIFDGEENLGGDVAVSGTLILSLCHLRIVAHPAQGRGRGRGLDRGRGFEHPPNLGLGGRSEFTSPSSMSFPTDSCRKRLPQSISCMFRHPPHPHRQRACGGANDGPVQDVPCGARQGERRGSHAGCAVVFAT